MPLGSPRPADTAQVLQAARAAAQAVDRDVDEIAEELASALHRDIPELPGDERSRAATKRAAVESIAAVTRTIARGAPAQATELPVPVSRFARAMARRGQGTQPVIRVVYLTFRTVLRAWEQRVADLHLPPDVMLPAVQVCQEVSFEWSDVVMTRLVAEYQDEHDRLARTGEVERARTIRSLLDGEPRDPDALSRALGYELGRHHTALVLWSDQADADAGAALERAAAETAAAIGAGKPLVLAVSRAMIWAWLGTHASPTAALAALGRQRTDGVSVAIGEPAFGPAGFRASHRDADDACRLAQLGGRRPGSVIRYRDAQLAAMFASDLERARRFVRTHLGELASDDDEHLRLRATLKVFLDEHGSRQATADRLGIHANTVGNRIRTCQELLGDSVDRRPLDLHVALALAERLGSAVLR